MPELHVQEAKNVLGVDDLFLNKELYESAPPSAALSPTIDHGLIQQPYSAPVVMDASEENTTTDKALQEHCTSPNSVYSNISGIEPLCRSSERDFSDSSTSWYPDSDEARRLKKKKQVIVRATSSESSESDYFENHNRKRNRESILMASPSQPGPSKESNYIPAIKTTPIVEQTPIDPPSNSENTVNIDQVNVQQTTDQTPKLSRWKKSNPDKWKINQYKANMHACLPYQGRNGSMPAKKPKPVNCTKCRYQCLNIFSEDDRNTICKNYWKIRDYTAQKQFLLSQITAFPIKTMKAGISDEKHRHATYGYYFDKNEEKHRVCKNFFLKTLCLSNGPVIEAFKNRNEFGNFEGKDCRGSRDPTNKTDPESVHKIVDHINSFPRSESHYCRKTCKRQYLDSKLSISKMYELYKEKLNETGEQPKSFHIYKKIFGTQFNLSFFKPKKDLCMVCTRYDSAGRPEQLKKEYDEHIIKKNEAQAAKESDKQRSIDDETYLVVTADMQSTLHIPVSGVGILYYTRKLNVQNYTIHTAKPPNDAYCITWNETNGKRGSIEIASAMNWWISQVPNNIKEITMYSDTCAGQNRNQYITAFLVHLIQRTDLQLQVLEQKYLESGHTHMEVDSMHSAIERQQRNSSVYSMIDWKSIMSLARSKRHRASAPPYVVKELKFDEMLDVRALNEKMIKNTSKDSNGNKIMWLKIKCLRFEKQCPGVVKFRYAHEGPYLEFNVFQKERFIPRTRKRRLQETDDPTEASQDYAAALQRFKVPKAYSEPLPISEAKKKDLIGLCSKGVIPDELHHWYSSLPTNKHVIDRLCEPDVTEEGEDISI